VTTIKFNLPDVGEGIAEVEISEWMVSPGDTVSEDDIICSVLTDKAAVEIPSPFDGTIVAIGPEAGSIMAVGSLLVTFDVEGAEEESDASTASGEQTPLETTPSQPIADSQPIEEAEALFARVDVVESSGVQRRILAAPSVRQRARDMNIDIQLVRGTGPEGRVIHADLDNFGSSGAVHSRGQVKQPDTTVTTQKITGIRRKIGSILQDTMQRIPHYSYVEEIDVTELEKLRAKLNQSRKADQPKLTMLPFIMKGLVQALKEFPQMASRYNDVDQVLEQHAGAHIGMAAQTDAGLLVPVIRHAEMLDLWGLAAQILSISEKARSGKATRDELSGSTITISSLGPLGGIVTTPVINSPEVAIIGVNKMATRPVWENGAFVPRQIMNLSSSFDHRIIDGWEATQFIQCIKNKLECPAMLFIDGLGEGQ
tara:strand:- start:20287 stop:21564 length:1278 start_codon:yes stop_codon:yes gene_type:complete